MTSPSLLLKRSSLSQYRPDPSILKEGEIVLNYNGSSSGLFLKDPSSGLIKIGPVEVSSSPPNSSPLGKSGNSLGELWFDTSNSELKIWTGSTWESCWSAPNIPVVGRMRWDNNNVATSISTADTYFTSGTSTRTLDPIGAGFSLTVNYPGLTYNKSESTYAQVTLSGCHNGSETDTFRFALAHVTQGTVTNFPTDIIDSSIVRNKRESHGGFYITEALLQLNNGDTVLPVVMCEGDTENTTLQSLSMTIRAI